jgi:hypothetical protein
MFAPTRSRRSFARWLVSIGAIVAIVAQVSVVLAPLGEAREGSSAAAHVEASGTSTHYAHNDATCVVCQVRSFQGLVARVPDAFADERRQADARVVAAEAFVPPQPFSPSTPRAPPSTV